jgi:hypothetical protein
MCERLCAWLALWIVHDRGKTLQKGLSRPTVL